MKLSNMSASVARLAAASAMLLFLVAAEGGSCGASPDKDSDATTGNECAVPADCDGMEHVLCEGAWLCVDGWCNFKCASDEPECTTAADCTGQPEVNCIGTWECVSGVCNFKCSGTCVPELEICDGIDNDCDGVVDEDCSDPVDCVADGDCDAGWICQDGTCVADRLPCSTDADCPEGQFCSFLCGGGASYLVCPGECIEDVCEAHQEICDGLDNDCDGVVDEGCESPAECTSDQDCPEKMACLFEIVDGVMCCRPNETCADNLPACVGICVNEGSVECSSDADCPEGLTCMPDGYCVLGPRQCWVNTDCTGEPDVNCLGAWTCQEGKCGWICDQCIPAEETCDGVDNDCDGVVDEGCAAAGCSSDADCENGQSCDFSEIDPETCCMPDQVCLMYLPACRGVCIDASYGDCQTDADCGDGHFCEVLCGNGWCSGQCKASPLPVCTSDKDCGDGYECYFPWACPLCVDCPCYGECRKAGLGQIKDGQCWYDSDCTSGQTCKGAVICPVGAMCIIPDRPGDCA